MRADQPVSKLDDQKGQIIMLPVGSCEQHGPYLPIDTDLRIVQLLAERVASLFPDEAYVLLPTLPFSSSWEHSGPGTISLSASTISAIIHDVADSLNNWSRPRLFILLNWHGGNKLLSSLAAEISAKKYMPTVAIHAISEASALWARRMGLEGQEDIHAGALETSIIKAFWPALITHEIYASDRYTLEVSPDLIQPLMQALNTRTLTVNGIWGSPHQANVEVGKGVIEEVSQNIFMRVQQLLSVIDHKH